MAVFARELTRESLWDSFKKRRVYGVTGDHIQLYFLINGRIMGEAFTSKGSVKIDVEAIGSYAIDRIEIIKNGRVLYTYNHSGKWSVPEKKDVPIRAKLRLQCGWGARRTLQIQACQKQGLEGFTKSL